MTMDPLFTTAPRGVPLPQMMPQRAFSGLGQGQQPRGLSRQPIKPPHPRPEIIPDELLRSPERIDLRGENLTEDDYYNLLSQYYLFRIEKAEPREKYNVNGDEIKPTWADCTRRCLPKYDHSTILSQVRHLNRQDRDPKKGKWPTILVKQSSLGPNAQNQIAKAHEDLSAEISDSRFHVVLDQIDWTEKPFVGKHGKVKGRCSTTRHHGSHGKGRATERASITAYFKLCPRPEHVPSELYRQLQREEVERQVRRAGIQEERTPPYPQHAPGQQAHHPQQVHHPERGGFQGVQQQVRGQQGPQQQPPQVNMPHHQQQHQHPQPAAGFPPNRPQQQGGPPPGPAMPNQGPPGPRPGAFPPNHGQPVHPGAFQQQRQQSQGPSVPPASFGQMPPNQGQHKGVPNSDVPPPPPPPHRPSRPSTHIIIEHDNRSKRGRGSSTGSSSSSSRSRSTSYSDSATTITRPSSVDSGSPPMAHSRPIIPRKPQGPGPNLAAAVPQDFSEQTRIPRREHSRDNMAQEYIITGSDTKIRVPQRGPRYAHPSPPEEAAHRHDEAVFQAGVRAGRAGQRQEDRAQRQHDHAPRRHTPARSPSGLRFQRRSTPRTEIYDDRDHGFRHVSMSEVDFQRSHERNLHDDLDTLHIGGGGARRRDFSRHDDRDDMHYHRTNQRDRLAQRARDQQEVMRQQERRRWRDELLPSNPFMPTFMPRSLKSRFTFRGDDDFDE